jgi:spore maturation protein CgeB
MGSVGSASGLADLAGPALRRHFDHARFVDPRACRVLVIEPPYYVGREAIAAFAGRGHVVESLPAPAASDGASFGAFVRELLVRAARLRPDFLLSINHFGFDADGALAGLLEALGIPVCVWYVDDPQTIVGAAQRRAVGNARTGVFVWERAFVDELRRDPSADYAFVEWLPLAVDARRVVGGRKASAPASLPALADRCVFVGSSWTELCDRAAGDLDPAQRRACEPAIAMLAACGTTPRADLLASCAVADPALASSLRREALRYVQRHASRRWRHAVLAAIPPEVLHVVGDAAWSDLLPRVPRSEPTDYRSGATFDVYRSAGVVLDVTSRQMPSACNQRVFDVPAVGGFCLSDAQADLMELFPPDAVVSYATPLEAAEKVTWYLARPARRAAVRERARAVLRERHTYDHRIDSICARMQATFSGRF